MNCILLPKDSELKLGAASPKLTHIRSVLKLKNGAEVFVGTLFGKLNVCRLTYTPDGGAEFQPLRKVATSPLMPVAVAVSFARPQIAQRILFEAACLGISHLIFYPATKGEADYAKSSLYADDEYAAWLEKGAEQACAPNLPDFSLCASLAEASEICTSIYPDALRAAPDLYEATDSFWHFAAPATTGRAVCLILGSERGFANSDRDELRKNGWTLVSLGARVMRTDTAFISACAILRSVINTF